MPDQLEPSRHTTTPPSPEAEPSIDRAGEPSPSVTPASRNTVDHVPAAVTPASRNTVDHVPAAADVQTPPTVSSPAPLPAQVGRYQIEGELGRGGMGQALRGRDPDFNRTLAVKVLLPEHSDRPELQRRFLEEAQLTGQLQHPGIPPVHAIGRLPDGRPFFSMKLIKGQTLADLLHARQSPAEELPRFLAIFGQVCQTLAYAHARGVIHRDLKPANIMVGAFAEVQVMDWGLAKLLTGEHPTEASAPAAEASTIGTVRITAPGSATAAGQVLGTPAYMPPEQARGEVERLDERCDVFGLGAILCTILTGQPPYVAASKKDVARLAAWGELEGALARLEACGADAELVQLAKRCLAREPGARPREAGAVARAVADYQAGVEERLRRAELEQARAAVKAAEERKRRRVTLALATVVLLLVAGAAGVGLWYQHEQAEQARRESEQALLLARSERDAELALQEAATLRERALAATADPLEWEAMLTAALAAARRGEALLAREGERASPGLRAAVGQMLAGLEADRRDWQLAAAHDGLRVELSVLDPQQPRPSRVQAYARLRTALTGYGLGVGELPVERAAVLLQARPGPVQHHVAAALQHCLALAPAAAAAERQWLAAVLDRMDGDPWRQRVRRAVAEGDWPGVEKLAAAAEVGQQTPFFLVWLADALQGRADSSRLELLRRAQRDHPGNLWINLELAGGLYRSVFPRGEAREARGEELPLMQEAVRSIAAALAARPRSSRLHGDLGDALHARQDLAGAIAAYRKAIQLDPGSAPAHNNLGLALRDKQDLAGAIAAYRKAIQLDPRSAPAHNNLGLALRDKQDLAGAIAAFQKAIQLDPRKALAHNNLGIALRDKQDLAGAIAAYQKAIQLDPRDAPTHYNLGVALRDKQDLAGAIAAFQKAIQLGPRDAPTHYGLGVALRDKQDLAGAIAAFQKAIQLDPRKALAHNSLGNALRDKQDLAGAIAAFQKAIQLDPRYAPAHNSLGNALRDKQDLAGAIAAFQKAIQLDPRYALAHYNLGVALHDKQDLAGAIAAFQKAIQLDPRDAPAHYNLGVALHDKQDLAGAIAAYQKAIQLDPRYATAHCNLGLILRDRGHFADALASLQRGHDLGMKQPHWRYPSAQWVAHCQRLLVLDRLLPAVLKGGREPKDAAEQLALADLCLRYRKCPAAAARFYTAAFQADAGRADDLRRGDRYNAACAAALAAAGEGEDARKLADKERTRLRRQALDWLRAHLAAFTDLLEKGTAKDQAFVEGNLRHWQKDADLASVRDRDRRAELPEAERQRWQTLWADVAALLDRVRRTGKQP